MDNERNNETQELMQPPRSLRILHYVDVVVGIGLINKHDIPPRPTGVYSNEEFYDLLYEISDFANSHDFSSFVEYYFGKSISYLEGKNLDDSEFSSLKLGEPYRKIYMATEKADIFGGMGTWLDSPRATAHIDGFEPEFNEITGKVIAEIDNSVDYLVHSDFREEKRQLLPCKKTDVENESIIDSSGSLEKMRIVTI